MTDEIPTAQLSEQPPPFQTQTYKAVVTSYGQGEYEITLVYDGRDLVKSSRFRGLDPLFEQAKSEIERRKTIVVDATEVKAGEQVCAVVRKG